MVLSKRTFVQSPSVSSYHFARHRASPARGFSASAAGCGRGPPSASCSCAPICTMPWGGARRDGADLADRRRGDVAGGGVRRGRRGAKGANGRMPRCPRTRTRGTAGTAASRSVNLSRTAEGGERSWRVVWEKIASAHQRADLPKTIGCALPIPGGNAGVTGTPTSFMGLLESRKSRTSVLFPFRI